MAKIKGAKLVELHDRAIELVSSDNVHTNGADNNYPERVKRVVNASVTAKSCALEMAKYIIGKGFKNGLNEVVINASKGLTYYDLLSVASKNIGIQRGFYLHVNYDINGVVNYADILPYEKCRISKRDDLGFGGLIHYSDKWNEDKKNTFSFLNNDKEDKKWFYPYNGDLSVINSQRRKDYSLLKSKSEPTAEQLIKGYRGQVLFVSMEPETIYPLANIDAAYNDADTENRISIYRNTQVRTGFLGATIFATKEQPDGEALVSDEAVQGLFGAENSSSILKLEMALDGDQKLADAFHIESIKPEIDGSMFEKWITDIKKNIMACFNFIPEVLISTSDGSLFSANSETLVQAQKNYVERTSEERKKINTIFNMVFKQDFTIVNINDNGNTTN